MIQISQACIRYKDLQLFHHLNVAIERGSLVCITGPSGCGKSSLLHALLGIVPLAEGEIHIDGVKLTVDSIAAVRRKIAWLPQEIALPCEWVSEMVQLPFSLKAAKKTGFQEVEFLKLLSELNLEPSVYGKRVNEISGGQRQRLMIASAALLDRPLILIDEPTSALDRESVSHVADLFRRLTLRGVTVVAVSHDAGFIQQCDQVIELV